MSSGPRSAPLTIPWQVLPKPHFLLSSLDGSFCAPFLPHQICVLLPWGPPPLGVSRILIGRERWDFSMSRAWETVTSSAVDRNRNQHRVKVPLRTTPILEGYRDPRRKLPEGQLSVLGKGLRQKADRNNGQEGSHAGRQDRCVSNAFCRLCDPRQVPFPLWAKQRVRQSVF